MAEQEQQEFFPSKSRNYCASICCRLGWSRNVAFDLLHLDKNNSSGSGRVGRGEKTAAFRFRGHAIHFKSNSTSGVLCYVGDVAV